MSLEKSSHQISIYSEAPRPDMYARSIDRTANNISRVFGYHRYGQKNVPPIGQPTIFAFTHRSYIDPWALGITIPRAVSGMAKKELLRPYYFGLGSKYLANRGTTFVDRKGGASSDSFRALIDVLGQGKATGVAPEGTSKNRGRELGETKAGLGALAIWATQRKGIEDILIVPVALTTEKLRPKKPIVGLIGQPIEVSDYVKPGARFNKNQRNDVTAEIDAQVRISLQATFDEALEIQSDIS